MSFNFFPINYKPKYSSSRTRVYISDYVNLLSYNIRQKFNGVFIQPPIVSNVNSSWNAHQQNERYISFDNKYTNEVNEILVDPNIYLSYALIDFIDTDVSLYTMMVSVKRDAQEKNGEVIANFNYYIQYRIVNDAHYEQQINMLMKNMLMMINQINQNDKFKDIEVPKYITDKINLISVQDLAKQFPTLTLEEALKYYVNLNGLTFIKGVYQQLPNGKRLLIGSPTMDDYANSTILYVFNKVTNNIVPIIKISSKPDKEKIKQQIILDTPNALKEQIYEKTVLNKKINFPSSINIKIYFSNLMLLNLSKMHLCEVIHSPCSEDLLKYFKENEIEVM